MEPASSEPAPHEPHDHESTPHEPAAAVAVPLPSALRPPSWRLPALATAASVVAVGAIAMRDPAVEGNWPSCPFFAMTGRFCPGCGSMRAIHALAHGDLTRALHSNVLLVVAVPLMTYLLIRAWERGLRGSFESKLPDPMATRWAPMVTLVSLASFWLVRNVPGFEFLTPSFIG